MGSTTASNLKLFASIPWKKFGFTVLSLPLIGLGFGVIYSILYDFEESNSTHCNVSIVVLT